MRHALRRHGPWLCVLAAGGLLAQGMLEYAAPAPRWDMAAWVAALALGALLVWRVRRASGSDRREVRSSRWHYGRGMMLFAGAWAAAAVCAPLGAGASELTPKVQRILDSDPVIRSSHVTAATMVSDDSTRGPESYAVRHRVAFDHGTRTVRSTVSSYGAISPGDTVWVLYDPAKPGLGGHTTKSPDQLEALRGGPADSVWWFVTAGHLGLAGMFALIALYGSNKSVRDGSLRGSLRSASVVSGRTGIAPHRPPERTTNKGDASELPETSGPFVELAWQDGPSSVRLFVDKSIEVHALARQLVEERGTLHWDASPPVRGADSTWALFVLDSGEEIPGVVQRSDTFAWETAGARVDRTDTRPPARRPVIHPVTWQPRVQAAAVPFIAVAVAALLAYAWLGSWIPLGVAWAMLPLACFAVHVARGMYLDENVTEPAPAGTDKAR